MFFILGINQKKKILDYNSKLCIHKCGKYERIEVFMIYTVLSLFFMPTIKWNKKYYVKYYCCNEIYELNPQIGKQLEYGNNVEIKECDLIYYGHENAVKKCSNCGYSTDEDFLYCPKCGNKI